MRKTILGVRNKHNYLKMSLVSPAFHTTEVKVIIGLKTSLRVGTSIPQIKLSSFMWTSHSGDHLFDHHLCVVYFDQLVEILFFSRFQPFCSFQSFFSG